MPLNNCKLKKPEILAIIPARGGSKGIPKKNLVDIGGHPLIYYSIKHALECKEIDRVVVSTDNDEIAEFSAKTGAEVPILRPAELAEDHVLDHPVFVHMLQYLEKTENYIPEVVVHLRPTAPYRKPGWISEMIEMLINKKEADSVRSVSLVNQHPYRMFKIGSDEFLDPIMKHEHDEPYLLRRQDLAPVYYYNCVLDVTRTSTILDLNSMTGSKLLPYIMNADDVIDLDTPLDLEILRKVFLDRL